MTSAQPGIFAIGTRSHYQLELDVHPSATVEALAEAICGLRSPTVTVGGANIVIAFGASLWAKLAPTPADVPAAFADFTPIDGLDGHAAPATQRDVWIWVHGTGEDIAFDTARAVVELWSSVAVLALEQPCFVYKDSRDITGFIDGTANPSIPEATAVACIPHGQPGAAGSFVLTQRWVHDLGKFHAQSLEQQEDVIGRTKADSVEMDDAHKPPTAHIARVEIEDDQGDERPIFRRSSPYGTVHEHGLYFLAFSADQDRFATMLRRMYGTDGDGVRDRLLDFSTAVTGSYFFAPSIDALNAIVGEGCE
jgi:putative iron-dependent peroxidase